MCEFNGPFSFIYQKYLTYLHLTEDILWMLALKWEYQSVFRVVSLVVCAASKRQVFGIYIQWDSPICRQIISP